MSSGLRTVSVAGEDNEEITSDIPIDRSVRYQHGPWYCPSCEGGSELPYRCSGCGHDLAGETTTVGRQEVDE